ncbi:hypothetical protein [Flavobacterium hercynium]|uniref:Lipoprotein n=1 Tax=Flavobacterium hercynium TaxID=387094 RepID=A0A226HL62_9FLAO|nr:hypothetical protein [Flavobacterium hercynium]OXA94371.1 hypothetical protein B0A66_04760 [Flavobacterium hercynium]SMP29231.1 hypothetical protein SAMN06265346_11241 [Flavobacterium hercynium]
MKKTFFLLTLPLLIISCTTTSTDLETLKFDTDILSIIKDSTKFEKDKNVDYGNVAYVTEEVDIFKYGNVVFSNLKMRDTEKNSLISYTSSISLYVDNFKSNKFSGYILTIENEKEGIELLNYIKGKFGKPLRENIYNKNNHLQSNYLWDDKKRNQVVYISQNTESFSGGKNKFISTELTVLKRGLKLVPDEGTDPEKLKKILEENPNALEVIEILKNRFY